ncbi:MAG: molybdopterin dinucleotide binding domain-containing protein [Pirellulales bacterium]
MLKELSRGMPCDFSGIRDHQHIDQAGGIQWPFRGPSDAEQERRLFANGQFYHEDGKARFLFENPRPLPERPNSKWPFTLLTGRGTASQWHTQTRTAKSDVLRKLYPAEPYVEMNPADARRLGIQPGEQVTIRSQRGSLEAQVHLAATVQSGQVFVPMHYDLPTCSRTRHSIHIPVNPPTRPAPFN